MLVLQVRAHLVCSLIIPFCLSVCLFLWPFVCWVLGLCVILNIFISVLISSLVILSSCLSVVLSLFHLFLWILFWTSFTLNGQGGSSLTLGSLDSECSSVGEVGLDVGPVLSDPSSSFGLQYFGSDWRDIRTVSHRKVNMDQVFSRRFCPKRFMKH